MHELPARVLYVEANEDGTVGGSHRALVDLVLSVDRQLVTPVVLFYQANRHVEALRAAGIEVYVYEAERRVERATRIGGGLPKYADYFGAIVRRRRLLREQRIDLVHLNNSLLTGFDDWMPAAKLAGVPCITFAMGDAEIRSRLVRRAARHYDHVIAISQYMFDAVRRSGVPTDRVSLAYLGVDVEQLRAQATVSRSDIRRELQIADDAVVATMVGNIREWKGQHVVLEALAMIPASERRSLRLLFVGAESAADADYRTRLDALVAAHHLGDNVQFTGGRSDVPSVLAASDIALHASVIPEPFGLVVPEAMAQGLPVIASKFGGPGEVVTESSGRLFDPSVPGELAAHLRELLGSAELRARLGREARQVVSAFSVTAMARSVESVYRRLLTS